MFVPATHRTHIKPEIQIDMRIHLKVHVVVERLQYVGCIDHEEGKFRIVGVLFEIVQCDPP